MSWDGIDSFLRTQITQLHIHVRDREIVWGQHHLLFEYVIKCIQSSWSWYHLSKTIAKMLECIQRHKYTIHEHSYTLHTRKSMRRSSSDLINKIKTSSMLWKTERFKNLICIYMYTTTTGFDHKVSLKLLRCAIYLQL